MSPFPSPSIFLAYHHNKHLPIQSLSFKPPFSNASNKTQPISSINPNFHIICLLLELEEKILSKAYFANISPIKTPARMKTRLHKIPLKVYTMNTPKPRPILSLRESYHVASHTHPQLVVLDSCRCCRGHDWPLLDKGITLVGSVSFSKMVTG